MTPAERLSPIWVQVFKKMVDESGTLVVIEAEVDVPFAFGQVDVIDLDERELVVDAGDPFLIILVRGSAQYESGTTRIRVDSPNDVVVADGDLPVVVSGVEGDSRVILVSQRSSPRHASPMETSGVAQGLTADTGRSDCEQYEIRRWGAVCPFEIKRLYFTHSTSPGLPRGGHAHWALEQVIISMAGPISLTLERSGEVDVISLRDPSQGVYVTPITWRDIEFETSSVLFVLASERYSTSDYIRDRKVFEQATGL